MSKNQDPMAKPSAINGIEKGPDLDGGVDLSRSTIRMPGLMDIPDMALQAFDNFMNMQNGGTDIPTTSGTAFHEMHLSPVATAQQEYVASKKAA